MVQILKATLQFDDGTTQVLVPEVAPVPTPAPRKGNIGVNPSPFRYWSSERVFNDLAMGQSTWQWTLNGGAWAGAAPGALYVNGYPSSIPANTFAGAIIDLKKSHPNGEYVVIPAVPVDGQKAAGLWAKTASDQRLLMRVREPINQLSIFEKGVDPTQFWYQPFVDRCSKFSVLRMMDWNQTNMPRTASWDTRTQAHWYTQADKEVALEYQVMACNASKTGLWHCIHHTADDSYITQTAALIKKMIDPGLPIYIEWSNELWNASFPGYSYCVARSPVTKSPLEYAAIRAKQVSQLFANAGLSVRMVFGAQAVAPDHFSWVFRQVQFEKDFFDAIAIAPYFGYNITTASKTAASVDGILNECDAQIISNATHISAWKKVADGLGLDLVAYEGGQHLAASVAEQSNATIVNNYIAANRHPRMYDLYRKYLSLWDSLTNKGLMCLFNSVYEPNRSGCWGLMEWDGQPLSEAHKYRAVLDHIGAA